LRFEELFSCPLPRRYFLLPRFFDFVPDSMKTIYSPTRFIKQAACPSAETLLSYKAERLSLQQKLLVISHLNKCDFCRAELHFLSHQKVEEIGCTQTSEIPQHLRQLAEAILNGSFIYDDFFSDEIYENESVS